MILAEKINRLRKKNGWSQEELAEKMNVSRQAVSKWESAQTIPDIEKILALGALFGVTTDYLLRDEIEHEEFLDSETDAKMRKVTLAEANAFIEWRKVAANRIAGATFLCVIAPIPLLLLGGATEFGFLGISENIAAGAGLVALLAIAAIAVAMFIVCGFRNKPYEFIDQEPFETEYGVEGLVREWQKAYRSGYAKSNVTGACICIISPIPLLVGAFTGNEFLTILLLTLTMLLAGLGAVFFIIAGVRQASMQKLLKEGDFSPMGRKRSRIKEPVATAYWLAATAVYLGWSFMTDDWEFTWIVWPVAGVLFAGVMALCGLIADREE